MSEVIAVIGLQEISLLESQSVSVVFPILNMEYYSYLGLDFYESIVEEVFRGGLLQSENAMPERMGMK